MSDIKRLEIKKMIREFEYVRSDYEYKSEIVRETDIEFLKEIDTVLNTNEELRSIYNERMDIKLKNIIDKKSEDIHIEEKSEAEKCDEESYDIENIKTDKIKYLYRQIAKLTHPDKNSQERLNMLYIEASKYYNENDILGIYRICDDLSIHYDIDIEEISLIMDKISNMRNRISFLENSFTWKWYNEEQSARSEMVMSYIRIKIT